MLRHVGDIAASWVLQVGIRAFPDLGAPCLIESLALLSLEKCFESFRIYIYRRVGFFLLLSPFVALVRHPDIEFWLFSSQISLIFFRITWVSWNRSDGFVTRTLFLVPPVYYVALFASCMYPHLLCNVDVMISIFQKRLQDGLLSLVGPSSFFRIGSHIGRDKLVLEPRPTIGAPLIVGRCWV